MAAWARVLRLALLLGSLSAGIAIAAPAPEGVWPRQVRARDVTLIAHQPQLDSWDGYTLRARLAVLARGAGKNGREDYGVVELSVTTLTDRGRRLVTLRRVLFLRADFPGVDAARARAWGQALARDLESSARVIALDRLEAALGAGAAVAVDPRLALRNAPPRIVFSEKPALLVYIDGAPAYRALAGTPFERVVNTRALMLRDGQGRYYLKVFDGWMSAPAAIGPWSVLREPDAPLRAAFALARREYRIDPLRGRSTPDTALPTLSKEAPLIVVATAPTELLVTDGEARFQSITGTHLSYVANSSGHIFRDDSDNKLYLLLSGRWFRAPDRRGPWQFVSADRLPVDFSRIPDTSPKENVKASVAGTAQARAAAIAAGIAQTARIDIATVMTPPRFDGEPVFETIDGTDLAFAANSPTPVLRVDTQRYFALENGVWFSAEQVRGPWRIALEVPASIYSIPPNSPLFNVTFVHVYGADDESVDVGYTPGYLGTLIDPISQVVVYGTGYTHKPWLGSSWYGRSCSYGFGAAPSYTPWTGWAMAFGFGWSWAQAPSAVGWGWGLYPWWEPWGWGWAFGPAAYPWYPGWGAARSLLAAAWDAGGWAGYSGNLYRNWGERARVARSGGAYETWSAPAWAARIGLSYNSRTGYAALPAEGATGDGRNEPLFEPVAVAAGAAGTGDDMYAGRDGRVYRRSGKSWQQFVDGGWRNLPKAREEQRPPPYAPERRQEMAPQLGERMRQLDRESAARQAGAGRVHSLRVLPANTRHAGAVNDGNLGPR